jgi:hypothetical protein
MDYTATRYQKDASDVSWARTVDFLAQHLKKARVG